ncbi:MAG: hypothetical protein KDA27_25365 [Candidatus Eisenbacteria bacterium]|uniref:Uncharacterized protein n=1 Tax=Eiseniibacteriota bacterium TaxID=2212470 RepID=A0A956NH87_UNCEI|nr:hypothetical protein [Candidatus Eisenbacteria bacterium]
MNRFHLSGCLNASLVMAVVAATSATAGPNASGGLSITLVEGVVYTTDSDSYCGAGVDNCADGIVSIAETEVVVLKISAAFPSVAVPRLAGVVFGLDYDADDITILAHGSCGDFELPTDGWPSSGEGTAVTWASAQTGTFTDVYWMAAYDYYGTPSAIQVVPHPTQGAFFADDDVPSNLDPIAVLGSFGFFIDGSAGCKPESHFGACCFPDGSCELTFVDECERLGGMYQGDFVDCDLADCQSTLPGACCIDNGTECVIRTPEECHGLHGEFLGPDVPCDPFPCTVVPVRELGWGGVKAVYR